MREQRATALAVVVLALCGPSALGIDFSAAYPAGDGGLFYAICDQLQRAHLAYPLAIAYNGFSIPFAYSPAAFFSVASASSLAHVPLGIAMNVWIALWALAIGPAAYWTAFTILQSRIGAVATAFYVVLLPHYFNYLGMGGGMTRCPGFVLLTLACGAIWRLTAQWSRKRAALAACLSAACAWTHMEFFLLLAISGAAIAIANRLSLGRVATLAAMVAVIVAPWPLLLWLRGTLAATIVALHTSHGTQAVTPVDVFDTMFGDASIFGLLGVFAGAVSIVRRQFLWVAWAFIVAILDSRAGGQVTHLPIGLAFGQTVAWIVASATDANQRRALAFGSFAVVVFGCYTTFADAHSDVRIRSGDVADMSWIATHTPASAAIVVAAAGPEEASYSDQTYEWLPAFAQRRSPTTFEGLEWVDVALYRRYSGNLAFVVACGYRDARCFERFAKKRIPTDEPWYLYVPLHFARSPEFARSLEANPDFVSVRSSAFGEIFAAR